MIYKYESNTKSGVRTGAGLCVFGFSCSYEMVGACQSDSRSGFVCFSCLIGVVVMDRAESTTETGRGANAARVAGRMAARAAWRVGRSMVMVVVSAKLEDRAQLEFDAEPIATRFDFISVSSRHSSDACIARKGER